MKLIDRVLTRLVGKASATAGCPYESWTGCGISGICPGLHTKYRYTQGGNCKVTQVQIGCC
ncbi:hypothetical protein Afil01_46360 [Actinorhabdospora filicis]|uniref:Uncharacterized protein n=1 Tax=Actinorhabdospora filicis TaxID=1785913 RepID=A0A9W6SMV5_9ACTN|nr:hypothetical protein [Actinorhabdospora filicis]GLZ79829.1 hypothetical protein Afil01_46360 [Actinorhabdospora filicis]